MGAYKMFSGSKDGSGGQVQSANSGGDGGSMDMINGAMKAYKMFSGDKGTASRSSTGGGDGGGNVFGSLGT
jgi:hypothetical protein